MPSGCNAWASPTTPHWHGPSAPASSPRGDEVRAAVRAAVADKLRVANPAYLEGPSASRADEAT